MRHFISQREQFFPHTCLPPPPHQRWILVLHVASVKLGVLGGGLSLGIVPPQALASYDFLMLEVGTCPASPFGNLG